MRTMRRCILVLSMGITVASAAPALGQRESAITETPEGLVLVQKDVGGDRWSVGFDPVTGTVTGNVFFANGSPPEFLWCTKLSGDADTLHLGCSAMGPCLQGPCADQWKPVSEVALPTSFFAVPGGSGPPPALDVTTYHFDNARTGLNPRETALTTTNVASSTFGKIGFLDVDGRVNAQPLYASGLSIAGATHDVVYAVTEHGSAYAFDADTGAQLWKVSALGAAETPSDDHNCGQISPEIGITDTPVIDRSRGPTGAIYFVAMSKDSSGSYHQRLHALDIATGAELFGGPKEVEATYPGDGDNSSNGRVVFDPGQYAERAGLLMTNGVIYTSYTSHCDQRPYTGWLIAYDASTLAQTSVLNLTPHGSEGSIWMSGTALAADMEGNIYFLDANGTFDTDLNTNGFPSHGDFGNAFLKVSTSGGLRVADYFATFDTVKQSDADLDLGSGGALVLPDLTDAAGQVRRLAVGAGKDAKIYVVDRTNMGKFDPNTNNIHQEIDGALSAGVFAMPAYFNGTVYYGAVGDHIKAFPITNAMLATSPASATATSFVYPGATPAISANGTTNGIVWAVENGASAAVLHAFDAADLSRELYNSAQAAARDGFGPGNKFIAPMIVNGKVFVGTTDGVAIFGLLH